jgi:hypothetical protein
MDEKLFEMLECQSWVMLNSDRGSKHSIMYDT